MFSLKSDLLFPSIAAAKELARKLNRVASQARNPTDPRELRRIREELRQARERQMALLLRHRPRL